MRSARLARKTTAKGECSVPAVGYAEDCKFHRKKDAASLWPVL